MRSFYLLQAIWIASAVAIPITSQSAALTDQQESYNSNEVTSEPDQRTKEELKSFENDNRVYGAAGVFGAGTLAIQALKTFSRKDGSPSPDSEVGSNTHKQYLRKMLHQEHEGSSKHRKTMFELEVARTQGLCERERSQEWLSTAKNEPRPDTIMAMKSVLEVPVEVRRKIEADCFEQAFKAVSQGGGLRSAFHAQLELENSRRRRPSSQNIPSDQGEVEESNMPELVRGGSSSPEQNQLGDDRWSFNVDPALKDVKQSFRQTMHDLPETLKQIPAAAMRSNAGVPRIMQAVP